MPYTAMAPLYGAPTLEHQSAFTFALPSVQRHRMYPHVNEPRGPGGLELNLALVKRVIERIVAAPEGHSRSCKLQALIIM